MRLRTRTSRTASTAVALVTIGAVALTGCTSSAEEAPDTSTLTLASPTDHTGFDPANALGTSATNWLDHGFYDRLVDCNADGTVIPNIAENWEVSADSLTLTFDIRSGMEFTDGTPVDAAAVKASIDYLSVESKGASMLEGISVEVADELTAVVKLDAPNPEIFTILCSGQGLVASPAYLASENRDTAPVGSGPYTYDADASTAGASYVMRKNPDNWNADAFPYDTVTIQVIEDPTAALNALKSGQVDAAPIPTDAVNEARSSELDLIEYNSTWAGLILSDRAGTIVPALGDADVRRAMNMVFDKQAYADSLFNGSAMPTSQIFRPGSPAYLEDLEDPYPYDLDAARELLAAAGYADGFDVQVPFLAGFGWDSQLPVVIDQLGKVGIRVEAVTLSGPNAIGDMLSGSYGMMYWPLGNSGNALADVRGVIAPSGVWNAQSYEDPKVTALIDQIWISTDDDESRALLQELNQYVVDEAWFAPIVAPTQYFAFDDDRVSIPESSDLAGLIPNLRDFAQ